MNMKKFIRNTLPVTVAEGAVLTLFSCGKENKSIKSISIAGTNISKYRIVYAKNAFSSVADKTTLGTEYDFDRLCAEKLRDCIKEATGVTLECVEDFESESANEILVGKTNRSETSSLELELLGVDEYKIAESGKKLVICGGSYANTWYAVDAFIEHLKGTTSFLGNASFKEKTEIKEIHEIITIGCVGDSITEGGSGEQKVHSYPSVLSRLLWKEVVVYNYGCGGASLRKGTRRPDGKKCPYVESTQYTDMMNDVESIDLMLIMLGTNDPVYFYFPTWTEEDSAIFKQEYKEFVDSILAKNSKIELVMMNCPFNLRYDDVKREKGTPFVRAALAELYEELDTLGYNINFYDTYTFTKDNLQDHLPDRLHFDNTGYISIAGDVADFLTKETEIMKQ